MEADEYAKDEPDGYYATSPIFCSVMALNL